MATDELAAGPGASGGTSKRIRTIRRGPATISNEMHQHNQVDIAWLTPDSPVMSCDKEYAFSTAFLILRLTRQVVSKIGSEMGAAIRRQLRLDAVRRRDRARLKSLLPAATS